MTDLVRHDIDTLRSEARRYVRPLSWSSSEEDASTYISNGSFFVVHSDHCYFGVTADHVLDMCMRRTPAGFRPRLYNHTYDVFSSVKSRSAKYDIATFALTPKDVNRIGIEPLRLPAKIPQQERGVVIAGYLIEETRVISKNELEFCLSVNCLTATNIGRTLIESHIDAAIMDRGEWTSLTTVPHGVSGAPMLTVTNERNAPLCLGGVVIKFEPISRDRGFFTVRRLDDVLLPNGHISE